MKLHSRQFSTRCVCAAIGAALLIASGCKVGPSSRNREAKSEAAKTAGTNNDFHLDLNCVIDHIQNPPEPFHYSYKHDNADDNLVQEADLTPDTIDGSSKDKYASRALKGIHSDRESWQSAWTGLTGISGMSSTIAIVRNGSAMVREGSEKMNGYDTVRYSIDTSRGDAAEAGLYRITLGDGGFEKGTAWVTAKGCPAKLSLDSEMHFKNGSSQKDHYEIEMIKK